MTKKTLTAAVAALGLLGVLAACNRDRAPTWTLPSQLPDRVLLTWTDDPARSQTVTWRTDAETSTGAAEIALATGAPDLADRARRAAASSSQVDLTRSDWNRGAPPVTYHSATFSELEPDTLYAYRVGDDGAWSEWHHFRTAKQEPHPFRFLYFGDAQNNVLSDWSRVLRTAYARAPDAAFALHAGDLVNDGHFDAQWAGWFRAGGWLHGTLPSLPVTGNHEYRALDQARRGDQQLSILWRPQFPLPRHEDLPEPLRGTVYWLDYQGARIVVLNSNRMLEEQALWLDRQLTSSPADWTIVSLHHPIYSSAKDRDNARLRELFTPLFERHDVDLVLQGHEHNYSRGHRPAHGAAPGAAATVYVVSVSGPKQYELAPNIWSSYQGEVELDRTGRDLQFFQIVDVEADRLGYRAYRADGVLHDAFEMLLDGNGEKTLVDLPVSDDRSREDSSATAPVADRLEAKPN